MILRYARPFISAALFAGILYAFHAWELRQRVHVLNELGVRGEANDMAIQLPRHQMALMAWSDFLWAYRFVLIALVLVIGVLIAAFAPRKHQRDASRSPRQA